MRASLRIFSGAILLLLPFLYVNCEKLSGFGGVRSSAFSSREPSAAGDSSDVSTFQPSPIGKVDIDSSSTLPIEVASPTAQNAARAIGKATRGEKAVRAGTRLMAIIDNQCRSARAKDQTSDLLAEKTLRATDRAQIPELRVQAYGFSPADDLSVADLVRQAQEDPCVLRISNDAVVQIPFRPERVEPTAEAARSLPGIPNDSLFLVQKHLPVMKAVSGWNVFFSPGRGIKQNVIVGVVDSGVDYNHPDLAANIWRDGSGRAGYNLVNSTYDPMDDYGHGTHVAGLIGAVANNALGVSGVMGTKVKILAVKVTDKDGQARLSDMYNGTRVAVDMGAEVINLSVGFIVTASDQSAGLSFRDALNYASSKNVVIAMAAGNDAKQLTTTYIDAPGSYAKDIPGMINVGSIDTNTGFSSTFSNYSSIYVQIGAPGAEDSAAQDIPGLMSTLPNSGYGRMAGTSMASPLVAGAAALTLGLIKSEGLAVNNAQVANLVVSTARPETVLQGWIKDGKAVDLSRLGRTMNWRYLIDGDGGTENPLGQ